MRNILLILVGLALMGAGQAHQKRSTLGNDGDSTRVQIKDWNIIHSQLPTTSAYFWDDFIGGLNTTQNVSRGWSFTAATSGIASVAGVAGHPGIDSMGTGATLNNYIALRLTSVTGFGLMILPEDFEGVFYIKPNQDSTVNTVTYRVGFVDVQQAPSLDAPTNGIYFERLSTDNNWFGVTRQASTETRTDAGTGCRNLWTELKIRYVDSATDSVGFAVNGTEVMATANLPTAALMPYILVWTNSTVNQQLFVDAFGWAITGLNR